MNGVKSFTIYEEYYDLITLLDEEEQKEFLLLIMKYMFKNEDIKSLLNDKQLKIFKNLKRPLDVSKKRSKASIKNETNENQNKIKIKSNKNQKENKKKTHQDVNVSNYDNNYVVNGNVNVNVNNKLEKKYFESIKVNSIFNEFLELRKKLKAINSERAINTLINKLSNYDEETQIKMIENSIVNSWKGIFEIKETKTKGKDKVLETLQKIYNE